MAYKYPTTAKEALSTGHLIETVGFARALLGQCAEFQKRLYDENTLQRVYPDEAQQIARGQLDSVNRRSTDHYQELAGKDNADPLPVDLGNKIQVDVYQTWQLSNQLDELIGKGWWSEFGSDLIKAYGSISEKVIDTVKNVAGNLGDGLKIFSGSLGWIAVGGLCLAVYLYVKRKAKK